MRIVFVGPPSFPPLPMLRGSGEVELAAGDAADVLREPLGEADVLLLAPRSGPLLGELLPLARRVRWIHTLAAGVEALPFDALRERDVTVTNSAGVFADALGEFAIAAMLWFAKDLRRLVRNQEAQVWEPFTCERLQGKRVGVIGYGGIGHAVGVRAAAMGMKVFATRRTAAIDDPEVTRVYTPERIDEMLGECEYVVLATPLTDRTRHLINRERIAKLRDDAVLINVSRGAVVDEAALCDALAERRIRGAALDVYETEPLPPASPLWKLDNVLLSPHSADHTSDSHARSMGFFLENLERFRAGQTLRNVVDLIERY
jgi:phosphoglycerate dehydrogenase-like enzyme